MTTALIAVRGAPLGLALLLAACQSIDTSARAAYFQPTVRGQFALAASTGPVNLGARQNDIEDSFGIGDVSESPYLRVDVEGSFGRVFASGFYYDEDATGNLAAGFGDIPAGTAVRSELTVFNARVAWAYDVLTLGPFRFSPGVSVDVFDITMDVTNPANGAFEQVDVSAGVPMVYASAGVDLALFEGAIDIGWMDVDLPDADGGYWDIDAMVKATPFDRFDVFAGYRFIRVEADGDADGRPFDSKLQIDGFYIGAGYTF